MVKFLDWKHVAFTWPYRSLDSFHAMHPIDPISTLIRQNHGRRGVAATITKKTKEIHRVEYKKSYQALSEKHRKPKSNPKRNALEKNSSSTFKHGSQLHKIRTYDGNNPKDGPAP